MTRMINGKTGRGTTRRSAIVGSCSGLLALVLLLTSCGCAPRRSSEQSLAEKPPNASVHAVRARKLTKIMRELDYLRSQRLPQEIGAPSTHEQRIDDIRTAADSLAHAAEDIPSVLTVVRLSKSDEDLFYELAEQLNARALYLRDNAASDPATLDAAFADVVSTCNACHSRFRVMPAANIEPGK